VLLLIELSADTFSMPTLPLSTPPPVLAAEQSAELFHFAKCSESQNP
jgi:hypothetical protein